MRHDHRLRRLALRRALRTLALVAMAPAWAQADAYPSRPITLVVGYPPGGSTDLTGRIDAEELGRILKAQVVVENQAGSGGALAAQRVARAAADGYTLMLASNNELVINQYINKQVKVDGQKDFTPIGMVASRPMVLVATRKAGVRTLDEFVEYGRVRAATFGSLADTANARLLKLRKVLADRYSGSSTDDLLNRVSSLPAQEGLGI